MCIVCKKKGPKSCFLFLQLNQLTHSVEFDQLKGTRTGGRGAYVCRVGTCVDGLTREGRLDRALKAKVGKDEVQDLIRKLHCCLIKH